MKPSRTLGLITARGGSKGIPRKNVKELAGKPLIAWTIEAAKTARRLDRLIVSTDDAEIAAVAYSFGAEVPFLRPAELARDDTPHIDTVLHAIHWLREHGWEMPDYLLTLQPTSPLRSAEDIDAAVELADATQASAVISVCEARQHPLWTKRINGDGTLSPFVPYEGDLRRQLLPPAFVANGAIYLNRCSRLLSEKRMAPADARAYVMPALSSLDIDTMDDWRLVELILRDRHGLTPAA